MAIVTSYNFHLIVNGTTMSDHVTALKVGMPQTANEVSAAGALHKVYRAGMGDPYIEATFRADDSTGGVNQTLRGLITPTSTGFTVQARRINTTISSANPDYTGQFIVSGDLMAMDDTWGEVPSITAKFVPVSSFSVVSTSS